jgi:hypothetical protein
MWTNMAVNRRQSSPWKEERAVGGAEADEHGRVGGAAGELFEEVDDDDDAQHDVGQAGRDRADAPGLDDLARLVVAAL